MPRFISKFSDIGLDDIASVGGKNASLGEMLQALKAEGVRVPGGFVITADAYIELIKTGGIKAKLTKLLHDVDKNNVNDLAKCGQAARALIKQAGLPGAVAEEICLSYCEMAKEYGEEPDVAVRSSATAEDLPGASFAGQQESFLNIRGEVALLEACVNCFASLFTDRAIAYRIDQDFDHMSVALSIGVQKMVRSDLAVSGVVFTLDPESGFRDVLLVTSSYGLGENVVGGRVDPDEFLIFKPTLLSGYKPIVRRKVGGKQFRMVYAGHGTRTTRNLDTLPEERERLSLTDEEALLLAWWACSIENHYSTRYGHLTPMDIEWAKDGIDGHLYVVQARPETVHAGRQLRNLESYRLEQQGELLVSGRAIGERIGAGPARLMRTAHELGAFQDGEVLVTDMTDPDWEPIMKRASAIVTNRGGRTCHAAIVSRELGVPCVVGTERATEILKTGVEITVSCATGT
ncbi:MAG: phosphoenolpyruvate synthase, partial [Candidatus Melainabacteria bacterium]|nr:phosphoenolpyruvate synthase [Candidatus Melainabacteria bacterium]